MSTKASAKSKKHTKSDGDADKVSGKVGDRFTYVESDTVVEVMRVDEETGELDVQEPDGEKRYWGCVPATSEWFAPAPAPAE